MPHRPFSELRKPAAPDPAPPEVYYSPTVRAVYVRFPDRPGWACVIAADVLVADVLAVAGIDTAGLTRYTPEHPAGVFSCRQCDNPIPDLKAPDVRPALLSGYFCGSCSDAAWTKHEGRPWGRAKGYNGTGVPCRAADIEGRVGERLEIAMYDNVTAGKTSTVTGVLDFVDDLTAMVSPLWSPWQVSINVHDIANVWTAEPR